VSDVATALRVGVVWIDLARQAMMLDAEGE
jgi:hypothetical protein